MVIFPLTGTGKILLLSKDIHISMDCSNIIIEGTLSVSNNVTSQTAIGVAGGSSITLYKDTTAYSSSTSPCLEAQTSSCIFLGGATFTLISNSTTASGIVNLDRGCGLNCSIGCTLVIEAASGGGVNAIAISGGYALVRNLSVTGSFSAAVVGASGNSFFIVDSGATVTNNATGKRCTGRYGAQFLVYGAGANRLPGDAPIDVTAAQFCYYG